MFIRSERLFLRPAWIEDRAELIDLSHDELIAQAWIAQPQAPRYPRCLITLPDGQAATGSARVIGTVGLTDCNGPAALHVWIAPEHCNKGYGTEAAQAALSLARALGHRHIVASHVGTQGAGGRLLAKLGFAATGLMQFALRLCPVVNDPADPRDRGMLRAA